MSGRFLSGLRFVQLVVAAAVVVGAAVVVAVVQLAGQSAWHKLYG